MDNFMPDVDDEQLLSLIDNFIQTASSRRSALEGVIGLLSSNYKHFNWAGIYILEGEVLKLGPFKGMPSPHTTIPTDKGICGASFKEKTTIIVPDVKSDSRYLACSTLAKSEIVVPIFKNGEVVAELDIDSNYPTAFDERDKKVLERVALRLSKLF
ncbi:MAG: GAF domain-containing protein [Candidatus Zixiibacteriota bacterium]|nr:MAG: GAF domain-containing protein [candidate division Zixibacteria bacterium]